MPPIQPFHVAHDHEDIRTDIAKHVLGSMLTMPQHELLAAAQGAPLQEFIVEQSVRYADKLIAELNKSTTPAHPELSLNQ